MSNYQRLGSSGRLGSFEGHGVSNHFLGDLGFDYGFNVVGCPDGSQPSSLRNQCGMDGKCYDAQGCRNAAAEQQVVAKTAPAAPESSTSAKDVLTGIAAILNPLAQAGVGIYAAHRGGSYPQQQPAYIPPPPPKSNTGLIVAVVAVVLVIVIIMMMSRGGN